MLVEAKKKCLIFYTRFLDCKNNSAKKVKTSLRWKKIQLIFISFFSHTLSISFYFVSTLNIYGSLEKYVAFRMHSRTGITCKHEIGEKKKITICEHGITKSSPQLQKTVSDKKLLVHRNPHGKVFYVTPWLHFIALHCIALNSKLFMWKFSLPINFRAVDKRSSLGFKRCTFRNTFLHVTSSAECSVNNKVENFSNSVAAFHPRACSNAKV